MNFKAITLMMMNLSGLAYGESTLSAVDRTITVCVTTDAQPTVTRARMLASKMFGEIGLSIDWQQDSRRCPAEAILASIKSGTPANVRPGAFAYALPYEGRHIVVFYDRIQNAFTGSKLEIVLAHVLAHEITHILQGVKRHSQQGVMKAAWDSRDYFHMNERPLKFAAEDVQLIYQGLAARQKRVMPGFNTDQSTATQA
jgi:hypothetical protein